MKAKLTPLGDRAIIKPIDDDQMTKAGIVLPDTAEKEKPEKGEVIAVGPGKMLDSGQRVPMSVKAGDKVIFKKYGPDEVKIGDEEILVVEENDIIAVYEE